MPIIGSCEKEIKTYYDNILVCEHCGSTGLNFRIFQKCIHVFWIPFFPVGEKRISCECSRCGADCEGAGKSKEYLMLTKTPAYMFSFLILLAALAVFTGIAAINDARIKSMDERATNHSGFTDTKQ
jgi:hypothetical protein